MRGERTLRVLIGEPGVAPGAAAAQAPGGEPERSATGCTVFLVHGAGGRAEQWRQVWPGLLQAGHRVVAFDALGHGDSPTPRRWAAYAGSEWAADLRALVEQHGSARNVLVGHSYGTSMVLVALGSGLARVQRAVLLAPPAPDAMRRVPWVAYLPVPLLERMRPKLSAGFRALAWGPEAPRELVDEETAVSDRNSLYVFKATWRQWLQLDAAALGRVKLPVQVLAGEADRLTPPDGARRLLRALARAELELLPGCGHQIPLERAQRVLEAVLAAAQPQR